MEWIEVKHDSELPRDERPFLAIFKGRICICQYDLEDRRFFICYEPSWVSAFSVGHDRLHKFTHWSPLPVNPLFNN